VQILVTDGTYKHTLGIVRDLGLHGFRPWVSATRPRALAGLSRFSSGTIVLPAYDAADFEPELFRALSTHRIELLMPVGAKAFERLVPLKTRIGERCRMITVEQEQLALCLSKSATYEFARRLGVPVPKTWRPRTREEVAELARDHSVAYPRVIKAAKEMGKSVVVYADDARDLVSKFFAVCEQNAWNDPGDWPLVQEYVQGSGCGFFAVYDRGQCGPTFQHRRVREMPPTGGYSVAAESYWNDKLLQYGKTLLDALQWHGVAMVEFKLRPDGEFVLMEINPKFWGSVDLALAAGVDFPLELVRIATGKPIFFSAGGGRRVRFHWPLGGELEHVLQKPGSLPSVLADCLDAATQSNLWLRRDPRPTLAMLRAVPARLAASAWATASARRRGGRGAG
jgi:predicted ATP-grasp superfamily ATP-dependent carboligase